MNNIKKALPTYFLLILIPAFFGLFLYFCTLYIDKSLEIEKIKLELSERAVDFVSKANPVDYFKPRYQSLAAKLFPYIENRVNKDGHLITASEASKIIKDFGEDLKENVRCALFDKNCNLINQEDLLPYEIRFYTYAWKYLHNVKDAKYAERRVDQNTIIGREFNIDKMLNHSEHCLQTHSVGKSGVFYFKNANEGTNGIILFTEYNRTNLELVESNIKDWITIEQPIILYDTKLQKRISTALGYKEVPYEQISTEKFIDGFLEDDRVWRTFSSDDYKLLCGQSLKEPNKYTRNAYLAVTIFLLFLGGSTVFFFKNLVNDQGMHISIRYKLICIFALAVYMPTLSLWLLSYTSLHDHRKAIENNTKKGMLDVLNKIDSDYKIALNGLNKSYQAFGKFLETFSGKNPPAEADFIDKIKELSGNSKELDDVFNWAEVRDKNLDPIFTTWSQEGRNRMEGLGRVLALCCIQRHLPEHFAKLKISPTDKLIIDMIESPVIGLSSVIERPREQVFMDFEGSGIYWYWDYITDENNQILYYMINSSTRIFSLTYFRSVLKNRYAYENTKLKLVNLFYTTQNFIPESAAEYKDLKNLINVSNISKTLESATVEYENDKYLCICMPGSNMKDSYILCMYPISEINYKIEKVRSTIYMTMILLLIISILTGLLLSKTFIIPVKELDRGLNALRKRETETSIHIENKDELGQLGTAFNQMMLEIKDMLIAGAVQQCLIPTGKFQLSGFDCQIYNRMATDVGGDYADIFELPGDRLLIVIGDVTGHGVSSALLTAMVKASTFRFAHKDSPLNEIVTNTSNMICDLLNKKKLMTFCAIILDRNTGEMDICNAGHPFPMIHSSKGNLRTPCKASLPMGVSKKRCRYKSESEVLHPGESLFLYTDGFPEAENEQGEEYGYNRFEELIRESEIKCAEELKDQLVEVFQKHNKGAELADDVTFIILKRNVSEPQG